MIRFANGDPVTWSSTSNGVTKTKVGVIVAVVPAGADPQPFARALSPPGASIRKIGGGPRDHVSYIVRVRRSTYYWPLVKNLKRVRRSAAKKATP